MDSKANWKNSILLKVFFAFTIVFWILTIIFIVTLCCIDSDSQSTRRVIVVFFIVLAIFSNLFASLYFITLVHDSTIMLRLISKLLNGEEDIEKPKSIWQAHMRSLANRLYISTLQAQQARKKEQLEQQQSIEKQKELMQSKQIIASNLNHEIKTPIGIIQGYIDTLIDHENEISPEMRRRFLQKCLDNTQKLQNIAYNISLITRIENGKEAIQMDMVDIAAEIRNTADDLTPILEKHGMRFVNRLPESLIVRSNKNVLYGIFNNLIKNAAFYSGGTMIIVEQIDKKHLSFRDNGKGVEPKYLNKIFERFYRIDLDKKRNLSSSGLGLSIVKESVEMCGWKISAHNYTDGGLQFIITL
ncbi:MAG: sensor histidine kinase [Muribaculaceae bacterium]